MFPSLSSSPAKNTELLLFLHNDANFTSDPGVFLSSRAGGPGCHPSNVPPARAEDPQPADDFLGPGCVWTAALGWENDQEAFSLIHPTVMLINELYDLLCLLDDICDYFGVKISMYFAWLGFYTNSMLYPAVIGFLLWILAESDQVGRPVYNSVVSCLPTQWEITGNYLNYLTSFSRFGLTDQPRHLLRGVCPLQRCVGDSVPGALEEARGRARLQVGNPGHPRRILGGTQAPVPGEEALSVAFLHWPTWRFALLLAYLSFFGTTTQWIFTVCTHKL